MNWAAKLGGQLTGNLGHLVVLVEVICHLESEAGLLVEGPRARNHAGPLAERKCGGRCKGISLEAHGQEADRKKELAGHSNQIGYE